VFLERRDKFFAARDLSLNLSNKGVVDNYDIVPLSVPLREEYRHTIIYDDGVLTRNPDAERIKTETGTLPPYDDTFTYRTFDNNIIRVELIDSPVEQIRAVAEQKTGTFTNPTRVIVGRPSSPFIPPILVPNLMTPEVSDTPSNGIPEVKWSVGLRQLTIIDKYIGTYGFFYSVREFVTSPTPDYKINSYNTLFQFADWTNTNSIASVARVFHAERRFNTDDGHSVECEARLQPTDFKYLNGRYLFRIGNVYYSLISYEGFDPTKPSNVKLKLVSRK
jgi:hypothetical protein